MKLYIIGNGFDRHFGLPTSVDDFISKLRHKKDYNYCNLLDALNCYGVDWGDYELSLADIVVDDIVDDNIISPDYLSDHERDRDGGIYNMECYVESLKNGIEESLIEMVNEANENLNSISLTEKDENLIETEFIVNFNYTSTVEYLYQKKCFHIHGFLENNEKLVFGYETPYETRIERELLSKYEEDHDYYIDTQKEIALNFYKSLRKTLNVDGLIQYLLTVGAINEVVVLGHSMNSVDSKYFELINELLKPQRWLVFYHDEIPNYQSYSFSKKVTLIHW